MQTNETFVTKWEYVLDAVMRQIDDGTFTSGSTFYTLQELCDCYAISNTTGRRVFKELKTQGFIATHGRAGTRVVRTSRNRQNVYMGLCPAMFSNGDAILNSGHFIHEFMAGFASSEAGKPFNLVPLSSDFLINNLDQFKNRPVLLSANIVLQEDESGRTWINHELAHHLHATIRPIFFHAFPGLENVIQLNTDLHASLYLPVQHLIELGHTRIGLVIGDTSEIWFRERLQGYLDALHAAGIGFAPNRIAIITVPEDKTDHAELDHLLAPSSDITALTCATDLHALAVLERCRKKGIRVPADLAITGSDDIPEARLSLPPLTSVNGRDRDKGALAASLLARQLGGESLAPVTHKFKPHLVVRMSSDPTVHSTNFKNLTRRVAKDATPASN